MNEAYAEWLIKRKEPAYAVVVKALMVVLCIVAGFLALTPILGFFGIIIFALVILATYLVFLNFSVEYEYLVVSGQISVDKILLKTKRKKVWEAAMEEVLMIAPSDSSELKNHEVSGMKVLDFTSKMEGARTYTLISRQGATVYKVFLEPNAKLLQCMKSVAPRKVIS